MYLLQDQQRTSEPLASEFYAHPYGGVARDIRVTREGFLRFFDFPPTWFDRQDDGTYGSWESTEVDCIGSWSKNKYTITFIDHSIKAAAKFVQQETDKLLKNYGKLEKVS